MPFWPKNQRWWRSRSISSPSSCYHYIAFSNPIPRQPAQPHRTECRQYWKVWVGDFGAWVVFHLDWYKCWEIRPIRYPIVHNSTELYSSLIEIIILIILIIIPNKNLPTSLPPFCFILSFRSLSCSLSPYFPEFGYPDGNFYSLQANFPHVRMGFILFEVGLKMKTSPSTLIFYSCQTFC